jgi:hypothetical protein
MKNGSYLAMEDCLSITQPLKSETPPPITQVGNLITGYPSITADLEQLPCCKTFEIEDPNKTIKIDDIYHAFVWHRAHNPKFLNKYGPCREDQQHHCPKVTAANAHRYKKFSKSFQI